MTCQAGSLSYFGCDEAAMGTSWLRISDEKAGALPDSGFSLTRADGIKPLSFSSAASDGHRLR